MLAYLADLGEWLGEGNVVTIWIGAIAALFGSLLGAWVGGEKSKEAAIEGAKKSAELSIEFEKRKILMECYYKMSRLSRLITDTLYKMNVSKIEMEAANPSPEHPEAKSIWVADSIFEDILGSDMRANIAFLRIWTDTEKEFLFSFYLKLEQYVPLAVIEREREGLEAQKMKYHNVNQVEMLTLFNYLSHSYHLEPTYPYLKSASQSEAQTPHGQEVFKAFSELEVPIETFQSLVQKIKVEFEKTDS